MTRPMLIRADAVADMLGLASAAAFLNRREGLEAEHYFPPPMPHSTRPLLWKSAEIAAWIDRMGRPNQPGIDPALITSGKVFMMEKARTA